MRTLKQLNVQDKNFLCVVDRIKNDINGNPRFEVSIHLQLNNQIYNVTHLQNIYKLTSQHTVRFTNATGDCDAKLIHIIDNLNLEDFN